MPDEPDARKVDAVSVNTRRHLQMGALLLPVLMEALREEYGVDFRGAASVSLVLSNPGTPDPMIRVTCTLLNGRMGADVALPLKMVVLNAGQIWGLDMPEAPKEEKEPSDDDVPDGYVKV